MPGTKEIKRRIKSVKNTKKITKAMELVAASKMKRAVSRALASRLYASYSWDLLTSLSSRLDEITHPFFTERETGKTLILLITSNRGLCGAYNSQVIKKTLAMLSGNQTEDIELITIGKKGDNAMRRIGQNITASFLDLPDTPTLADVIPLSKLAVNEYKGGTYKHIYVAYTDFVSALTQKPHIRKLLPISKAEIKEMIESVGEEAKQAPITTNETPYTFDGDIATLIESLAEKLTRMQIYQMILESNASEQSARMIAMKNASEAAGEMIDDLTLAFNKARQAGITREISEISAGMASIS
ncbi:MAG: ATP synthase F1 subunit gamma [Candidatus Pacebacteria bacterium]|jgi:F-type H+-transporting ATPase subunit gamma|nr:ATP synthase F1 subunit gamma [Candidatus Paceibacterota bacterium]